MSSSLPLASPEANYESAFAKILMRIAANGYVSAQDQPADLVKFHSDNPNGWRFHGTTNRYSVDYGLKSYGESQEIGIPPTTGDARWGVYVSVRLRISGLDALPADIPNSSSLCWIATSSESTPVLVNSPYKYNKVDDYSECDFPAHFHNITNPSIDKVRLDAANSRKALIASIKSNPDAANIAIDKWQAADYVGFTNIKTGVDPKGPKGYEIMLSQIVPSVDFLQYSFWGKSDTHYLEHYS